MRVLSYLVLFSIAVSTCLAGTFIATPKTFDQTFNADQAKLPDTGTPAISNSTNAVISSILFDPDSTETASWNSILDPYNGGTLRADIFYSMVSGSTGTVNFGVYVMCVTAGDSADVDTASFGTINSTSTNVPGTAGYLTKGTVSLSNGDGCTAGDVIIFKLERTATSLDTAVGDAEFRKLRIYE